jgi:hypothetical protein
MKLSLECRVSALIGTCLLFDAFSSREPASTSLENAIVDGEF